MGERCVHRIQEGQHDLCKEKLINVNQEQKLRFLIKFYLLSEEYFSKPRCTRNPIHSSLISAGFDLIIERSKGAFPLVTTTFCYI